MKIVHVSKRKKHDKDGLHLGGVEAFSSYLKEVIPEMELFSWLDFNDWLATPDIPDFERASMLNTYLLEVGGIDEETIVIVDGYWGLGLEGKVARLISVCHGSLYGRFIQSQIYPWGGVVDMEEVEAQLYMFKNSEVVSVSSESHLELLKAGVPGSTVIRHGVPLDKFMPYQKKRDVWMHAATSARKGADLLHHIAAEVGEGFSIEAMNERSGIPKKKSMRLSQAKALIAPTRHEGNSYLLLEALASGTPLLTYQTGLACEMDERCGIITDDLSPANFGRHIRHWDEYTFAPREWAEENFCFADFERDWRDYLDYPD